MPTSFPNLLVLLGALQGFILTALLWFDRKGIRTSNRLLAALLGLLALASLAVGIPNTNPPISLFLDLAPLIMVMPMGPLIFFYTRSVLDPAFRVGKNEWRHFYPVVLDWGAKLVGGGFLAGWFLGLFDAQDGPRVGLFMDEYNAYVDIPRWISLTAYALLAYRWLRRYENGAPVDTQAGTLRWLRQFLTIFLAFQSLWLLFLIPYALPAYRGFMLDSVGWYWLYVPIAGMIYGLGLKGYLISRANPVGSATRKAGITVVPTETTDQAIGRLKTAMQTDCLYLDPELTVEKLGRHVRLPAKTVSFVLNQHLQKSFNAFVNEHRIEAVKQHLADPANGYLTLTGIAFECGFNSQATFQRTFKHATGLSPKEFLNQRTAAKVR